MPDNQSLVPVLLFPFWVFGGFIFLTIFYIVTINFFFVCSEDIFILLS